MGAGEFYRAVLLSGVDVQTINQFAKFLAWFEEKDPPRRHFDLGSRSWIASDACTALPRVEASEPAEFNLIAGSQNSDDADKYGADDDVRFLQRHPDGLVSLFDQIGPGHLAHPRRITKKSIKALPGVPGAGSSRMLVTRKLRLCASSARAQLPDTPTTDGKVHVTAPASTQSPMSPGSSVLSWNCTFRNGTYKTRTG